MRRGFGVTLADLLVEDGVVAKDSMDAVREIQKQRGGKLESILLEEGVIDDDQLLGYSSLILESVPIHLDGFTIPQYVLDLVPVDMAHKHQLIPIARILNVLTVAMSNPWDIYAIESIENYTKLSVSPVLSSSREVQEAIKQHYSSSEERLDNYLERIQEQEQPGTIIEEIEETPSLDSLERLAEDAPIVGLVDLILRQAIERKASDIHIEPYQDKLRVRFRLDGVLEEINTLSKSFMPAVVSRIKVISNMNIAERRQPQDGRLKLRTSAGNVSFRVSSLPSVLGEKVVMRLADETQDALGLDQLGMSKDMLGRYIQSIRRPHGLILVTGPTGSGKTSTLYSSLNLVNGTDVNVITIEDPVERISGEFIQVEVNQKAGRTFASILRSVLRQDPDIIMVGEIRDFETAKLAIQAALTGHLVFSTLHTNDAPSAIPRLLDLAVEPFLISASVLCVVAQRLVRLLCPKCKEPYEPTQEVIDELKLPPGEYTFFKEKGCPLCDNKGYKGRVGVYEVMFMNDEIRELAHRREDSVVIQEAAVRNGMKILRQAAIIKAMVGLTSVSEALRTAAEI